MDDVVRYVTHKPVASERDPRQIRGLSKLMEQVLAETRDLGLKSLHTPVDRKAPFGKHEMCYWLEKVDPHHRKGYELRDIYADWCSNYSGHPESFWQYLDRLPYAGGIPAGETVEMLTRPEDREDYQIVKEGNRWVDRSSRQEVDTIDKKIEGEPRGYVIYVANHQGDLFIDNKSGSEMHHSAFLAGGAVLAAGTIMIRQGRIRLLTPYSGHYRPSTVNMYQLVNRALGIEGDAGIRPLDGKPDTYRVSDFRKNGMTSKPMTKEEVTTLRTQAHG